MLSPIELEDSDDSLPKPAAGSTEEREDSNSQAEFEDSKKEIDPEKIPKLPPGLSAELEKTIESLKNVRLYNEPAHDKTNKMICAHSEDSDQPGRKGHFVGFVICSKFPKNM